MHNLFHNENSVNFKIHHTHFGMIVNVSYERDSRVTSGNIKQLILCTLFNFAQFNFTHIFKLHGNAFGTDTVK